MTALLIFEGIAILLLGVLVVGLLRSHAEILRSLHQLGVGEDAEHDHVPALRPRPRVSDRAPSDVTGQSLRGSAVHIGVSGTETATMLAFLSSGCSSCVSLWHDLKQDPSGGLDDMRLVVVTKGPEAESQSRLIDLAPRGVTVVQSTQAWDDYGVPVTPYFVLIDGETAQVVGEGSASSWGQVNSLLGQALADARIRNGGSASGEMRADSELRRAGIGPGHPSLYPDRPPGGDDR